MPEQVPKDDDIDPLNRVDDAAFHFSAHAVPLRLFYRLPDQIVREATVVVGERETAEYDTDEVIDGLHIRAVDPANVAYIDVTLPAKGGAFGSWDVDDTHHIGVNLKRRRSTLDFGRMSGSGVDADGDPVSVRYGDDVRRLETTITRSSQATQRVTVSNMIDPDSIREIPDRFTLDLWNRGHPESADALKDAVDQLSSTADHVVVSADNDNNDGWTLRARGDTVDDTARFLDGYEWAGAGSPNRGSSSLFSMDYLKDVAHGLKRARVDKVTVRWGDEFPAVFGFFDEDYGIRGHYMIAPRIESD